jgi:hypothetical protein
LTAVNNLKTRSRFSAQVLKLNASSRDATTPAELACRGPLSGHQEDKIRIARDRRLLATGSHSATPHKTLAVETREGG